MKINELVKAKFKRSRGNLSSNHLWRLGMCTNLMKREEARPPRIGARM
jgi:hypothetical protein